MPQGFAATAAASAARVAASQARTPSSTESAPSYTARPAMTPSMLAATAPRRSMSPIPATPPAATTECPNAAAMDT